MRARPPFFPPSLPSATAAGFLRFAIVFLRKYLHVCRNAGHERGTGAAFAFIEPPDLLLLCLSVVAQEFQILRQGFQPFVYRHKKIITQPLMLAIDKNALVSYY